MKQYKCKLCGEVFTVKDGETPVCPLCGATGDALEVVETAKPANKYAGTQTEKNLHAAFDGESGARNKYTFFASVAKKEGFEQIAALFEAVAAIEKEHEERYRKLLANVQGGLVFSRDEDQIWQCSNCGHIHVGKQAPEVCPVCAHPQAHFVVLDETYKR